MSIRAPITPEVIKWARETARFSLEEAAKKLTRPISDIEKWESGALLPTMAQARRAAILYKRPLAVFYLKKSPSGWQVLRDFRTLPSDIEKEYSRDLEFLLREIRYRQEWLSNYLKYEEYNVLNFIGTESITSDAATLANKIRNHLDVTLDEIRNCRTNNEALLLWIKKSENSGFFIFRDRQLELTECRGLVLVDDIAPSIYINANDAKVAQIFTLAHELVHVWINQSGISNLVRRGITPDKESLEIEQFCNKVASLIILEPEKFKEKWLLTQTRTDSVEHKIEEMSRYFKVSREVVARRLFENAVISRDQYRGLRRQYHDEWVDLMDKGEKPILGKDSFPSYYQLRLSQLGKNYSRTVLGAYLSGEVTGRDASALLNIKVNNLAKFADKAGLHFMSPV